MKKPQYYAHITSNLPKSMIAVENFKIINTYHLTVSHKPLN